MIPILFEKTATTFDTNGLGALVDCSRCEVVEELNGTYELRMDYPVDGHKFAELAIERIIVVKPNNSSSRQAFQIYAISKPINGICTVSAEHISYRLGRLLFSPFGANYEPFTANTLAGAITALNNSNNWVGGSYGMGGFSFVKDTGWSVTATYTQTVPMTVRSVLGGVEGSMLDVYGGEYEWDNFAVKIHQHRGADNGVVIAAGKNLTGVKCDEDMSSVATGCIAFWKSEDDTGSPVVVRGTLQTVSPQQMQNSRYVLYDASGDYVEKPTVSQLNAKAISYLNGKDHTPKVSVTVEFVNLGDTEEYKQYRNLETVNLGDTVTVKLPSMGISVRSKVTKYTYNCLDEKYEKIEVGKARVSMAQAQVIQDQEISKKAGVNQLSNGAVQIVSGNTKVSIGNADGHDGVFRVVNSNMDLMNVYPTIAGNNSVVWTPAATTNASRTNRKGIGFDNDSMTMFGDKNGYIDAVIQISQTGDNNNGVIYIIKNASGADPKGLTIWNGGTVIDGTSWQSVLNRITALENR